SLALYVVYLIHPLRSSSLCFCFFVTLTPLHLTLSLHDALPISSSTPRERRQASAAGGATGAPVHQALAKQTATRKIRAETIESRDRKSTRLNSSHVKISYAVFCLKKKRAHPRNQFKANKPKNSR